MVDTIIRVLAIVFPVVGTIIVAIIGKNATKAQEEQKQKEQGVFSDKTGAWGGW